jgi:signal transduction histidine kinase
VPEVLERPVSERRALVVMRKGPARDAVVRVVASLARDTGVSGDPFDATARFAEGPADLVVASVDGWRRRDLAFVAAARARRPAAAVLLLVPPDRRALAAPGLAAGADAYLGEPVDLGELAALARRLIDRAAPRPAAGDDVLARLASAVGHAVNNPLQVMSLVLEEDGTADPRALRRRDALGGEMARIRDAVEIVAAYGRVGRPAIARVDLDALVAERWDQWARAGLVTPPTAPPRADRAAPVEALADAGQLREAVDAAIRHLAAVSGQRPAALRAAARPSTAHDRAGVEVALRVEGLVLDAGRLASAAASVLEVDEVTRVPYPGLALPAAVARAHGGRLARRESRRGTVLLLRLR